MRSATRQALVTLSLLALAGASGVGPGRDVVDVAALGWYGTAGGVLAVPVADFDGAA